MATQAQITINGTAGSNTDLLINSVVQLNNDGLGGEVTYEWALLSQPAGTPSAVLSSTSIQSPTFTVNKEGTYLIRLIVNKGLADEKTDTVIAAVRELETRNRIPAVGETTENGLDEGWAIGAVNDILQRVTRLTDSGMFVAYASEALIAGNVVHMSGMYTLAAGLPGERKVPKVNKALATVPEYTDGPLGVVISDVAGNPAVTLGELCRVMVIGALPAYNLGAGGTVGAPVYVDDNALLSLTPGTNVRSVGDIAYDHGDNTYDIAISSIASSLPTGAAGGDLGNFYPNPSVAGIHGKAIDVPGVDGNVPYYDTASGTIKWGPQLLGGKVVIPPTGDHRYPYYDAFSDSIKWDGVERLQGKPVDTPTTGGTFPYYDSGTSTIKWGPVALDYAPSVTGTLQPANGGLGNATVPAAGVILYGNGTTYAQLAAGTSSQILRGGTTPSWGTVPTAAFADNTIPCNALQVGYVAGSLVSLFSTSGAEATMASGSFTAVRGPISFKLQPYPGSGGTIGGAYVTTTTNNTSATLNIKAVISGVTTSNLLYTYAQYYKMPVSANNNQITGSITFPTFSAFVTTGGTCTITFSASISGGTFTAENFQLFAWQG